MSYLRSLARHAVFPLAAKRSLFTYGLPSLVVVADAELLAQALGNVLDNAIDLRLKMALSH